MIGVGVNMKTFTEIRNLREAVKTVGPKWQKDGKLFPITPNQWKKEWKSKYNVEFIRVEKKKTLPNRPQQTFVFVKGEEKDLADWFMKVYAKQPGMNVPLLKSASKTLDMVKDADDGRTFGFSIESVQEAGHKIDRGRQAIGLLDKQRAAKVRAIAKKYKLKTDEHPSTKYRPPKDAAKLKGLVDITLIGPPGIVDKAMKEVPMHPDVAKLLKQHNESVNEAYSKNLSDREIDAQFKKFSKPEEFFGDLDQARAEMKQDYSPANSARPKAWNSLSYPVRDGDYYFAFISKNEKKNMKFNEQMNDMLKDALKEINRQNKAVRAPEVRDLLWDKASEMVSKLPRDLGAGDTMTREEIWMSIGHMLGMNEDVKEMRDAMKTKAGIKVGRRAKAPRYESKVRETKESKFRSFRANIKNLAEAAGFEFVDMDKKRRDTVVALAKKFKLKVKERKKGSLSNIDVEGSNANVAKFMQNLPQDALEGVQKEATSISMRDIMRKHGRELKKVVRTGNLELSDRAEEDLLNWAYDNGEVMTDDPDEFIEWLDNNIDDIVKGRIR